MNIAHVLMSSSFTEGLTYQDNQLTEQNIRDGHNVLVVSDVWRYVDGALVEGGAEDRVLASGIHLVRLPYVNLGNKFLTRKIRAVRGLYELLEGFKPDLIFIHGPGFLGIVQVVEYVKKHSNVKVVVDNHADFSNSARNWLSFNILHKIIYKWCANQILPYVTKFYGVLPARCDFLHDVYDIPKEKIDFLPMGADDLLVQKYASAELQQKLRTEFGYKSSDFVVVTGGKIDKAKTQVLKLMQAVNALPENVKLLVFGSVDKDLRKEFDGLCSDKVKYAGWADVEGSYKYFSMADVVCFPAGHSVYWEQAVAQGKPLLVKYRTGIHHLDYGGNVEYIHQGGIDELKNKITVCTRAEALRLMQEAALVAAPNFLYSEIAKKVLQDVGLA